MADSTDHIEFEDEANNMLGTGLSGFAKIAVDQQPGLRFVDRAIHSCCRSPVSEQCKWIAGLAVVPGTITAEIRVF